MRKFKFTMESILKIKISIEKQLKNSLAEAEDYLNKCIKALNDIEEEKVYLKNAYRNSDAKRPSDLKNFNMYYTEVERRRISQIQLVEKADIEFKRIQKQLIEAMAERKMFEKLKEKQYEEYLVELKNEQDKQLDDILSYKITEAQG